MSCTFYLKSGKELKNYLLPFFEKNTEGIRNLCYTDCVECGGWGGVGRRMMSVTLIELLNDLSFDQFWAQINTGRKLECRSVNHSILDR